MLAKSGRSGSVGLMIADHFSNVDQPEMLDARKPLGGRFAHNATFVTDSYGCAEYYDKIKVRTLDITPRESYPM